MHAKLIVALAGMPAAGKSTVADHLAAQFGFRWVRTRDIVSSLGADGTIASLQSRGLGLASGEGAQLFFAELTRRLDGADLAVVDALRPLSHWSLLKEQYSNARLVAVHAPYDLRKRRLLQRDGSDDLAARDEHPVEREVPELMERCSFAVVNVDDLSHSCQLLVLHLLSDEVPLPLSLAAEGAAASPREHETADAALRRFLCL